MGSYLFDQYTYLHFATGIVAYFWGVGFVWWFIFHSVFEWFENTETGINLINNVFTYWPGGKPKSDSFTNIIGDTIGALIGWITAFWLDKYGSRRGWYQVHTQRNII